jgi:hypothetical protein
MLSVSSEMSASFYQTALHHITEDCNYISHYYDNLISISPSCLGKYFLIMEGEKSKTGVLFSRAMNT